MGREELSGVQFKILIYTGLMAPVVELLPSIVLPIAGKGVWLSVLFSLPLAVLLAKGLLHMANGHTGLAGAIQMGCGVWVGKFILILYLLWGEWLLALRLRLCAQRLLSAGERDGSLWFFLPVIAVLVLWMSRGKLTAFARTAQIFFWILLICTVLILGLSLTQVKMQHLLPVWREDIQGILTGIMPVMGTLGYGIYGMFLSENLRKDKTTSKGYETIGFLSPLIAQQVVILGSFGTALTERFSIPFFALAKSVGVEGAFQRVESMVAAIWMFADVACMGMLLYGMWNIAKRIYTHTPQKSFVSCCVIPAVVIGAAAFSDGYTAEQMGREVVVIGNLILGVALPVFLYLIWYGKSSGIKKKKSVDK